MAARRKALSDHLGLLVNAHGVLDELRDSAASLAPSVVPPGPLQPRAGGNVGEEAPVGKAGGWARAHGAREA